MDWRWLAICCSVPPTLLMVSMCFMPETPRYLLSRGKRREAEEALRFLRGPDAPVEWECARIEEAFEEQVSCCSFFFMFPSLRVQTSGLFPSQGSSFHLFDLKDPGIYKPLMIGVMLMAFQQMTGINAIMFYAESIFKQAKFQVPRAVFLFIVTATLKLRHLLSVSKITQEPVGRFLLRPLKINPIQNVSLGL